MIENFSNNCLLNVDQLIKPPKWSLPTKLQVPARLIALNRCISVEAARLTRVPYQSCLQTSDKRVDHARVLMPGLVHTKTRDIKTWLEVTLLSNGNIRSTVEKSIALCRRRLCFR